MDEVLSLDHDHSGDDDCDLPFPPNPRIGNSHESSDGDRNLSEGGEGPTSEQFDYVHLHVVHDYRAARRGLRGASRGGSGGSATRIRIQGGAMGATGRRLSQGFRAVSTE
jgi:hypothetical protein